MRIAVASVSLGSGFPGDVYRLIKKQLRPGETLVEIATITQTNSAFSRRRMLSLLEGEPRPAALIGICVRPEPEVIERSRSAGIPVVLIDEEVEGTSTVASDNLAGGHLAGQHLVRSGRRTFAVVSGQRSITGGYNAALRVKGFASALSEHHLHLADEDVVEVVEYTHREGMQAMRTILDRGRPPDAVFCAAGDACATGILAVARERGVKVPEGLAVLGYDDSPLASIADPPLSTVAQPLERIAAEAHRLATQARDEILSRPKKVLFAPRLVSRRTA